MSARNRSILFFLALIAIAPFFQNCSPNFAVMGSANSASTYRDPLAPLITMLIGTRTLTLGVNEPVVVGQTYNISNQTSATLTVTSIPLGNCLRTTATAFSCVQAGTVSIATDPTSLDKVSHAAAVTVVRENDLATLGASVYGAHCASCHGTLASSTKRGSQLLALSNSMVNVPDMVSLASLSSQELIALKVALSGAATPPPTPPPTPTPTQSQALYATKCSGCHGELALTSKRGRSAASISSAIQNNVGGMRTPGLLALTPTEIQMIEDALR